MAEAPQSVSVTWAMYLGSPVSVPWVRCSSVSVPWEELRPQTNIIARNLELHSVTDEVGEGNE